MVLCLVGHHPIHSMGGYTTGPGPERFLQDRMPALSTTRPLVLVCLLNNELLNNSRVPRLSRTP
jgi:hypothetical protein